MVFETMLPEVAYLILVFVLCMLVYFKTQEIYELTAEKSVRYFRNSFLFLGLAYFSRSLLYLLISWGVLFEVPPQMFFGDLRIVAILSGFLLVYFGSLSILYLIFSLIWKKFDLNEALMHLIALSMAFLVLLFKAFELLAISQISLFAILAVAIYVSYKGSEVKRPFWSGIYPLYLLLFVFWVLNVLIIALRIPFEVRAFLYVASGLIIVYIAYRVLKKV